MKNPQAVRNKLVVDIKDLDGGLKAVAEKLKCSERYVQDILSPSTKRRVRLATFEKVKKAVQDLQQEETERELALLA